jgi:DNA-binding transcriptional MerR regulator
MLTHWDDTGLLRPSVQRASGRGSVRLYSLSDVIVIRTIKQLRDGTCPLQKIRAAVRYLRSEHPELRSSEAIAQLTLVNDGKRVMLLNDRQQLLDVMTRQMVWALPIGQIIQEVTRQVSEMPLEWSEHIEVLGRTFRVRVSRDTGTVFYLAQCREMPAVACKAASSREVLRATRKAIEAGLRVGPAHGKHSRTGHGTSARRTSA